MFQILSELYFLHTAEQHSIFSSETKASIYGKDNVC